MDAATQLALMAKASKVFGSERAFLSFPVTPLPFTRQQLAFLSDQNLQNAQTFASLVNLIPAGQAWLPTEARYLWDAYGDLLDQAELASSTRTPEEEARYQQAARFLRAIGPDGTLEDTAVLRAYRQHKDAYLMAQQGYNAARSTGETTTDPAVKQRWLEVEEPALRAALAEAERLWTVEGFRHEVEAALQTLTELGARSPLLAWKEWREQFMPDITALSNPADLSMWFPSSFAPANALEEGAWQPFRLLEDELRALLAEAPAEARARLGEQGAPLTLSSLTCEFSSAAIVRPWFAPELFQARFWRLGEGMPALSDGQLPPAGACPAYVAAVVFARNVVVTTKASQATTTSAGFDGMRFPVLKLLPMLSVGGMLSAHGAATQPVLPGGRPPPRTQPVLPGGRPPPRTQPLAITRASGAAPDLRVLAPYLRRMRGAEFMRRPMPRVPDGAGSAQPGSPAEAEQRDTIYILAFICKALPQCPNPDPALQW